MRRVSKPYERRQAFAERQAALGKGLFAGEAPQGSGEADAYGPPRLPVGQHRWREHGGPVRRVTPQRYAWKGAKWIKRITFSAEGYSNTAHPWFDDRFTRRKQPLP